MTAGSRKSSRLDEVTPGQVCTVLKAESSIDNERAR